MSVDAWTLLRNTERGVRARGLRAAAAAIREDASELVAIAAAETSLSAARLGGEIERTASQAELFADLIDEGRYLDAAIDHEAPGAPELRRMRVPIGPVAVFAAGNFPFAFGVFGGDTVSALAAGCPVVVKTHPDLPETSSATHLVVRDALESNGFPVGALRIVTERDAGRALVEDPSVAAVGFTGSVSGGRALFDFAAARETPIPVFAEMSSTNPTVVAPEAAETDAEELAEQLAAAVTASAGQLCTKPGLIFIPESAETLIATISGRIADVEPQPLLSPGITERYEHRLDDWRRAGVRTLVDGRATSQGQTPMLGITSLGELAGTLEEEVFGPAALLVTYGSLDEVPGTLRALGGQLTTTVRATGQDLDAIDELLDAAASTSGRVIVNGVPTGVRVAWATTHGGPYPASTNASSTSVGASAIDRWMRAVTWQSTPDRFLPDELREDPRSRVPRRVDGVWEGADA
ncbi:MULTISPECIES: aldehyde dehydrogenase family protein [unclassified Pseudoclavibacter]|uniref:aldehyde dehydrogenase family protein n=1 Tax=unclassified Pseudoclavibacter TaxID=2615177 RepID=UPI001BA77034|nr:aldehyde dehydrogenase family protein [Pseudoclavibacter sp. Marseille-Q4354]MBS3180331.1 aldehyde dehydrogenase family protein [Pseudoclavibacter sp. Marseille-Q4354]